jgi:hypothetical protein
MVAAVPIGEIPPEKENNNPIMPNYATFHYI